LQLRTLLPPLSRRKGAIGLPTHEEQEMRIVETAAASFVVLAAQALVVATILI
jgi:hypothetical protein